MLYHWTWRGKHFYGGYHQQGHFKRVRSQHETWCLIEFGGYWWKRTIENYTTINASTKGHVVEGMPINVRIVEITKRELANREIVKKIIAK